MDGVDRVDDEVLPELPKLTMPIEYRVARARRNAAGRRRLAENGRLPNGKAPFGYWLVTRRDVMSGKRPERDLGKLLEHEEHAGIVRSIFRDYLRMRSTIGVAEHLNRCGIPTAQRGPWTGTGVLNLLRNTAYVGRYVWGRSELAVAEEDSTIGRRETAEERHVTIPCPALVSERTFLLTQEILKNQGRDRPARGTERQPLLLGDIARCADCGELLVSGSYVANRLKDWQGGGYYACKRCAPGSWGEVSPRPQWRLFPRKTVERATWDALKPMLSPGDAPIVEELVFAGGGYDVSMRARRKLILQAGLTPWVACEPIGVTIGYREGREATDEQRSVMVELLVSGVRVVAAEANWAWMQGREGA